MKIAQVVREIRERLDKSQSQFAAILRCSQNSISRYESGQVEPGLEVLLALHSIAKGHEFDQSPYRQAIETSIKNHLAARGQFFSTGASIENLRGVIQDSAIEDLLLKDVNPDKRADWHAFLEVVVNLLATDRVVDDSLVELLSLWAAHSPDHRLRKVFRDAAAYVRVQLSVPE